jgi:catechol 2,3-dioxygenase-like lactoylglutathione lyase family enzyme
MKGPMRPGRIVGVTLRVRDRDAAVRFYEAAFGLRWNGAVSSFEFGEYPRDDFFLLSILDESDEASGPLGPGHIGLVVDDLAEAHTRALGAGAREWYSPHDNVGAPRSSGVEDADGNRIELWQA